MKAAKKSTTEGKRFSRREFETYTVEGQNFWLARINWNDVFTPSTIERYKTRAIEVLEVEGVPVDSLLEQSPHGSMLRDYVLNHMDMPPDSLAGLASGLLEVLLHVVAYQAMPDAKDRVASLAFNFGRLTALFDVYEIDRSDHAKRRADKPTSDPYDSDRNKRLRAFYARLIADGARDANQQTADEFDLSARQVSRIVKPKRT